MSTFFLLSLAMISLVTSIYSKHLTKQISEATEWSSRRSLLEKESCRFGNPIDDCWRCDSEWETNRKMLADCAIGFGRNAVGGRDGEFYVVTDSDNDDPVNPFPGTLRYGVIQEEPLWIIFDHDMVIKLKEELLMNSYKTIDGRGYNIQIAEGPCITIQNVSSIIIHNIYIRDCIPAGNTVVRDSTKHAGMRGYSDGDGISIYAARDVWIDHCTLANCRDGLIDAVLGSTAITVSNNYMLHHNEVMLMGHSDDFLEDKNMQVTIAFNFFGDGLTQRMPRCRHGYFHIVNNIYTGWEMYAIGGSANPTINSQGNVFVAKSTKEVTKREISSGDEEWKSWNWRSDGDMMLNGAFFTPSGEKGPASYMKASSMVARPAAFLTDISPSAGALDCQRGQQC
ncbi:probable pectate lyase 22 [Ricinus communis]|uniref:probable pectate lyase 22 n=1 Tax=Ricinus communis TaxID=3988 RepID=UPI0007726C42|nr:probable pectate lyase 22 [Ricinus communis]|eukprot:XP_015577038.1 probable pectate lyase 22 [Ricinus communis]